MPVGFFSTPEELGGLLTTVGWQWTAAFQTFIYITQLEVYNPTNIASYISFNDGNTYTLSLQCYCPTNNDDPCIPCSQLSSSTNILALKDGTLLWTEAHCLGLTGAQGPTGSVGPQGYQGSTGIQGITGEIGPTGQVTYEYVYDALVTLPDVNELECVYTGIYDCSLFTYLDNIVTTYGIATALNTPTNLVAGPITFNNNVTYQNALNALHIVIVNNVVNVTSTPSIINRIFYFNSAGNVISTITVSGTKCCPTGVNEETEVLTKLTGTTLGWVSGECFTKNYNVDLPTEICSLPQLQQYQCCLPFDVSLPFLGNDVILHPTPWQISEIVLFGQNLTTNYAGLIYTYVDLGNILVNNNWQLINSSIYQFCEQRNSPITNLTSSIKLIDTNNIVFYSASNNDVPAMTCNVNNFVPICTDIYENNFQLIYKTSTGVVLGSPDKLFNTFNTCVDITFTCTTVLATDCFFFDLAIPGPWTFTSIILSGISQIPLTTSFSTIPELQLLLLNMGWLSISSNVYTFSLVLDAPNTVSTVILKGYNGTTQTIILTVDTTTNCNNDSNNILRSVLTKDENNTYCWLSPECLRTGPITVLTCCTGCTGTRLEEVNSCALTPRYDISMTLYPSTIAAINTHFQSYSLNPPATTQYWIQSYQIDDGTQVVLNIPIQIPLSVYSIAYALTPPWSSNPVLSSIDVTQNVVMTVNNLPYFVVGININLQGQNGSNLPFNYLIPIEAILGQDCPGLSSKSSLLLKKSPTGSTGSTGSNFCWVDVECLMPIIPPAINLPMELADLPVCNQPIVYETCVIIDSSNVEIITTQFGTSNVVQIVQYLLVGGTVAPVNQVIGANPTLAELIGAFLVAGWLISGTTSTGSILKLNTDLNIEYIVLNVVGSNPNLPPYNYNINIGSCSTTLSCPSTNPLNSVLIKKLDNTVCWTPICPSSGAQGPTGFQGPQGIAGAMGVTGPTGSQGPTGIGILGNQGPQGVPGAVGSQGAQGPTGNIEDVEGVNIGVGEGVYGGKDGINLTFKSLVGGDNISLTTTATDITINVNDIFNWGGVTFTASLRREQMYQVEVV